MHRQRCAPSRGHVEFDDVSFRYVAERPLIERPVARRRAGPDGRHRRADRGGQDDARQPDHALLRARRWRDPSRWRRHRDDAAQRRARRDRHGAPGRLAVRRHDPRQHRLRRPRRDGRGDPRGGADQLRRPLRALAPRRLRHGRRRRGQQPQRRGAPAAHDRQGVPRRPGDPHPRRGDELGRHRAPRCSCSTPWPRCAPTARAS